MQLRALGAALPALLRAYWVLATAAATAALLPLPFASGFRSAVLLSACRGKLMDLKPPAALGPLSDWDVPQRWFAHFYALGAAWNVAVSLLFLASDFHTGLSPGAQATSVAALALLELHLLRRLVESVWVMRYPQGARMHGVAYIFGLSYYLAVPLTLLPGAALPSMAESLQSAGWAPASWPTLALPSLSRVAGSLTPVQWVGVAVFLAGNALQLQSHVLLARLAGARRGRRGSGSGGAAGGAPRYRIPRGGAFHLVSCPHYLAEVVLYLGLALLAGAANPGPWLMVAWVVVNLTLAGGLTHAWYRRRFKTYPKARRAIFPFVY